MRELQAKDVFVALRLFKAMDLNAMLTKLSKATITDENEMGAFVIGEVLSGLANPDAEKHFYSFMGNILELSPNEVEKMNPMELLEKAKELKTIIKGDDWKNFFAQVFALLK